ncbi:MAG TPA: SRPBCC family protein [Acidimicrobiia bacterium]|jgi:hypothetical protein|nr:SRPBCC family protein [Acidimicrobiia bacterium]
MTDLHIDATLTTTADPAAVWKLLGDIGTWTTWGRWTLAELEREGKLDPAGVGAIRRFRYLGRETREEVVGFDAPTRFAYELMSGLPLRNYHAEVTVVPDGAGARLDWHSVFDATPRARLVQPYLAWFVRDTAKRLLRAAERDGVNSG